jgi:hypothetical protein
MVKMLGNILAIVGIILVIYCILARLTASGETIRFGIIETYLRTALTMANSLILTGIFLKTLGK